MGVIQRQSIKYSIVNLIGLGIGTLSTLLVYPHVLEANGLMRFLLDTGIVLLPVLSLGANYITIRYFPKFENREKNHNGFLPLILGVVLTGFVFWSCIAWISWDWVAWSYRDKSPMLQQFLPFLLPVALFYVLNQVLFAYSANFKRIVVPSLLTDFSQKLILPILLLAVWQGWISLEFAVYALVIHGALVSFGLIFYLKWLGAWRWGSFSNFITPDLRNEMLQYAGFSVLSGFALLVAARGDIFFVGTMTNFEWTGIFAICTQIALVIEVPIKGLYAASQSSVSKHLADENYTELGDLYKRVSINLLVAGLLLFFAIWISLDDLFSVLYNSDKLRLGKWVFFFIGLSRLVEMTTGMNNLIIYYSKFYRWSLVSLSISAIGLTIFNLIFIPKYGIEGAAFATFMAITCYNFFTVWLVWKKLGMQPFSVNTLKAIGLALVAFGVAYFLPGFGFAWLDIFWRSGAFVVLFAGLVFYFKIAPDLNEVGADFLKRKQWLK